ncbi:MAG TPA: WS/DGAT domain-containing protein [Clostridia bacterium]|nr:WS/DGAT domain-containing protein [Clostridia bacterium]
MNMKVEMWDKMQHIMARYNDHMVHVLARFEGELDAPIIKKAFELAINKVKILKSVFVWGLNEPSWREIENFDVNDVFFFCEPDKDPLSFAEEKLLTIIKETKEAQIKVWHIRHKGKDMLAVLLNHMCFDGADTKVFLYYVAKIYNDLLRGGNGRLPIKQGARDSQQVYKGLTPEEYDEAMKLISYSKKQKARISYPFESAPCKERYPKINKLVIDKDMFVRLKARTKEEGVSLNDIMLAAFFRATHKFVKLKEGQTLGIPNMVDLRRYLKNGETEGLCNLTSMVVSNIGDDIGKDIFETVRKVKDSMDALKSHYPGLHGLPLLKKVLDIIPYPIARFLIGTFFKNPLIGVSNIGIIDEKRFAFDGAEVGDVYMTGSVKYPPYMQLAISTFRNTVTHTVAVYGTRKDHEMFDKMLKYYNNELKVFIENRSAAGEGEYKAS